MCGGHGLKIITRVFINVICDLFGFITNMFQLDRYLDCYGSCAGASCLVSNILKKNYQRKINLINVYAKA